MAATKAIRVLAHQLQADTDEVFMIFEYKRDYQTFFSEIIHTSNVFQEIDDDEDYGKVAKAIFAGTETNNDYFTNAATQVFEDVLCTIKIRDGTAH